MSLTLPEIKELGTPRKYLVERRAALLPSPINTSFTFHSNSTTATSSSTASANHIWSSIGRSGFSNYHPPSALSATQEKDVTLPLHPSPKFFNHRHYVHSTLPSPPLLSARSSAFLAALQHSVLYAVDAYLHGGSKNSTKLSSYHQTTTNSERPGGSPNPPEKKQNQPLRHSRKVAVAIFSGLILAVITLTAFFASKNHSKQPRAAQLLIMGAAATIVALVALLMLAAERSVKEILAMAAVAFTICQCVQNDLSNSL